MMVQYQTSAFRSFGFTDSYTWSKRSGPTEGATWTPKCEGTLHYAQYISTNINKIFIKNDIPPLGHAMRNTCAYYKGGSADAPGEQPMYAST